MVRLSETRDIHDFLDRVEVPDDLEDRLRASVYPSVSAMPPEVRREHKISFYLGMMPKDLWTREEVERIIDEEEKGV